MSARKLFAIFSLGLCFCASVTEGRLFARASSTSSSNDVAGPAEHESETTGLSRRPASVEIATRKFHDFGEPSKNTSMCARIHPEQLPEECSCSEPHPYSLVVECHKVFSSTYFNDTIGMKIDLDPCDEEGAKISLDVTEEDHNIDFPLAGIRAGERKDVPIPGLAMIVPGVGNVGLDVSVFIAGNPTLLRLKVGLNACAQLSTDHQVCASSIPGLSTIFPWYVLKGTYNFGGICESKSGAGVDGNVEVDGTNNSDDTKEKKAIVIEQK